MCIRDKELNDADAAALGIADGDRVRVTSRRGSLETTAQVSAKTNPGQTWMPFQDVYKRQHGQDGLLVAHDGLADALHRHGDAVVGGLLFRDDLVGACLLYTSRCV